MSYEADETYAVYDEQRLKARKTHTCSACDNPIPPGNYYVRVGLCYDSRWETVKRCLRCQKLHVHLRQKCREADGYYPLWPDERLACGRDYEDEWDGEPPPEILELAFKRGEDLQPEK